MLADAAVFNPDDGSGSGGFVVHWLNNKDLSFTSSTDLFMLQLRKLSEQQLEQTTDDPLDAPDGSPLKFDFGTAHSVVRCCGDEVSVFQREPVFFESPVYLH